MRVGEAEPLRPIPSIDTSDDEDLIKAAMLGAFLITYNTVRAGVDVGQDLRDVLDKRLWDFPIITFLRRGSKAPWFREEK